MNNNSVEIQNMYRKYFPRIIKFVLQNNGCRADAEDIFHKALIQITVRYRKEKFIIKSSFEAYLFTACKNLWRRQLKENLRQITICEKFKNIAEDQDQALSILEEKRRELFTENLNLMPENSKKILELFLSKVPYETIMEQFGYSSKNVVRQRVFQSKNKLKIMIKNDPRYNSLYTLE